MVHYELPIKGSKALLSFALYKNCIEKYDLEIIKLIKKIYGFLNEQKIT